MVAQFIISCRSHLLCIPITDRSTRMKPFLTILALLAIGLQLATAHDEYGMGGKAKKNKNKGRAMALKGAMLPPPPPGFPMEIVPLMHMHMMKMEAHDFTQFFVVDEDDTCDAVPDETWTGNPMEMGCQDVSH